MASLQLAELVIDCPQDQIRTLLDFYGSLTGYTPYFNASSNSMLENKHGMDLGLQPVDGYRAPTWPSQERGQQIHLDFAASDIDAAVELAEMMGGKRAPDQGEHGWTVMLDPAGHPFCFVQHRDEVDGDRRPVRDGGPSITLRGPFIDCPDHRSLADFYLGLLGGQVIVGPYDEYVVIMTETGRPLAFQRVEGYQPPTWPTQERGQQMHFDVYAEDKQAGVDHATSIGAEVAFVPPGESDVVVMLDPAGHPFCICQA